MKRAAVLGGGFAGVESAIFLVKAGYDVTLVSDREFLYLYPLSIWVPTGEKRFEDVCIDLKSLQKAHGFTLLVDAVSAIDAQNDRITLASGKQLERFDHIIFAMGAHKLRPKGIEHTLSICGNPVDALKLHERIEALIAEGGGHIAFGFGGNPKDSSSVRGGPGFELMFNVHHMLKKRGVRERFTLTFFAPMAEPGKRMGPKALDMPDSMLQRCGIGKRVGKKITAFDANGVAFEDESRLDAELVMFIPAGNGHALLHDAGVPLNEAGYVRIDDQCRVAMDHPAQSRYYAVGDIAAIEGPQWRAKQGHIAEVMARCAVKAIVAHDKGEASTEGYRAHLNILCIMDTGDGAAMVYRDDKRAHMISLPVVGHWLKKAWGAYFRCSKLGKIPRLPGL